jgi:hypothetical protein
LPQRRRKKRSDRLIMAGRRRLLRSRLNQARGFSTRQRFTFTLVMTIFAIDRVLRNSSGSTSNSSIRCNSSCSLCLRHRRRMSVRRRRQRAFRRLDLAAQRRAFARRRVQRATVRNNELVGALLVLLLQELKLRLVLLVKLLELKLKLKLKLVILLVLLLFRVFVLPQLLRMQLSLRHLLVLVLLLHLPQSLLALAPQLLDARVKRGALFVALRAPRGLLGHAPRALTRSELGVKLGSQELRCPRL